jgi:D-hydroxyproline dehydrogenase subunit beta
MTASSKAIEADVCVVGAGMLGLAHALEARQRGLSVIVIEREWHAVGASVRNFGHLFFSSLGDGDSFDCALGSRERWLELGRTTGLAVRETGSVVVARADDELAVLEAVAGDPAREALMLTAKQVTELVPIPDAAIVGALHCTLDLRVDPRVAIAALADSLASDTGARVEWGRHVHEIEPGRVQADGVTVNAPAIVVCPGPDYRVLPPAVRPGLEQLTLCRLQMLRVAAPLGRHFRPALATGLSMIRYPAFARQPAAAVLRERLSVERPELLEAGIHLLIAQLPDGDLVIGDTHTYGETLAPFGDERLDELLLAEACSLLGVPKLEVRERWHGIYPSMDGGPFLVTEPLPGVRVVENVSGLGMTLAFGFAPRVLDSLLASATI